MLLDISLCPCAEVFIPSSLVYLLSSKQDRDTYYFLEYKFYDF